KIDQPRRYLVRLVRRFQCIIIGGAAALDGLRQCDQARLADGLRQRLLRKRAGKTPVTVLERMDADKIEMGDSGAREAGQRLPAAWSGGGEPVHETTHLVSHRLRGRSFEMDLRLMQRPGDDLH